MIIKQVRKENLVQKRVSTYGQISYVGEGKRILCINEMFDFSRQYRVIILNGNKAEKKNSGSNRRIDFVGWKQSNYFIFVSAT